MKIHDVIYVPGLGDQRYKGQQWLISTWRLFGVRPHMVRMDWNEGDTFEPKLQKLLDAIDEYCAAGHRVSLVGASAGAGAVLNAFAARKHKISGVVCICGKINNAETIGRNYRRRSPAFVDSAYRVQSSLDQLDFDTDRSRILSRYAWLDPIVAKQDSVVVGAHNRMVPTVGHGLTIATQLLFGAPSFLRFLKNAAK